MQSALPNKEEFDQVNGWAETRNMNQRDQMLRKACYKIHARPKTGSPVWLDPEGVLVSEPQAVASVTKKQAHTDAAFATAKADG